MSPGSETHIAAAILIGGQSRRMGQDKSLLTLESGGRPVIRIVADRLREVATEVVLVGGRERSTLSDLPRIDDRYPGSGPLGGIATALAAMEVPVFVVACDMPFLNTGLVRHMLSLNRDCDVILPVLDRPQPLHAIWFPTALPIIERDLRIGDASVMRTVSRLCRHEVIQEEVARFDPELLSCFNMNTPEDYEFARRIWSAY